MMYPENQAGSLNMELFRHPPARYRSIPFWSWNCRVTRETIDRQLRIFKQMGFGGVDIHPRTGLDTVYLSDEYMELIRYAVRRCRELDLLCWLYDDDRFPSGAADGLVTREVQYRQRCLLLTETPPAGCLPDQPSFNQAMKAGKTPCGWHAATYAVGQGSVRRLHDGESACAGETLRYAFVMLLEGEDWFQGQTYLDVMNPAAVQEFIRITHEAYFRTVGTEFGTVVPAIFTDEPRMETRTGRYAKQLKDAQDPGDVIIPWSDTLQARLQSEYQTDLLDMAPALVWELPDSRTARYRFRNAAAEQFVSAFLDPIAEWCRAHHILMTGHVLSEDSLSAQAASLGDCMRCYRSMDLPGVDVLCDDRLFLTVKQAASVAHQLGREGVTSELYGVTEWNCDFRTFRLQGDWQAALGVTARVPHLAWMSMEGEAKRDWPGSIFSQSPYWEEFSMLEDYFARLNTVLTRGKPRIRIAVIHPVESMWLHLGNVADTLSVRREMDAAFDALICGLLLNQKDFDLISESLLPDQHAYSDACGLHVGEMTYTTVLMPDMDTIRMSTLNILRAFREQGGCVIFTGRIPRLVDACPSADAEAFAGACMCAETMASLCGMLDTGFTLRRSDGAPADNLLSQWREDGDTQWLFLCHAYPRAEKADTPENYIIRITGRYAVEQLDPMTGQTRTLPAVYDARFTVIPWTAYAEDSLLLRLRPGVSGPVQADSLSFVPCMTLLAPDTVTFGEPNMLLMDYARARVGESPVTEKEEILRLDTTIRNQLGIKPRYGAMMQPYAIQSGEPQPVTLYYEVVSETDCACELAMEHPERCRIVWNGQNVVYRDCGFYVDECIRRLPLPGLVQGRNTLVLTLGYDRKTNLESLYLLGDFDVQAVPGGNSMILPGHRKTLGDLTRQGMPFWSGRAVFRFGMEIPQQGTYAVRVPVFSAALLTVRLDGQAMGRIAFAPNRLVLGSLKSGRHTLEITAVIGRHNGFGYLHNSNDAFRWFGPDAWRTRGDEWTDAYRVKPVGILSGIVLETVDMRD